ncbi:putative HTH-type transcriptional regulator [Ralstonia condita]|jgi:AraC-like DNA-binding protein|uniref:HTH-type transcriptional regulator n=1 Tax=Ralstonia condita TaxID=3058600 RepID=A0ABM9IZ58_9RALS|nr:AraC family transcriptional regulator [Ralstonia sp. LMG 7141]MDE2204775.1 AraC family transcriptional regulator [Burkholderiaceae bacterium]CAJ0777096.1 putative HTH-type transcriptional regulator [Ralstonia sp. LMG 7141]
MQPDFPLSDERIHRPHKLQALIEIMVGLGVDAVAALAGTGLAVTDFQRPETRISARQLLTVCENALRLSPRADLALRAGLAARITQFGLYGYALLCSPTAREAIAMAMRYRVLTAPLLGLEFVQRNNVVGWRFSDVYGLGEDTPLYRFVLEWQLGTQLALHRDVLGAALRPLQVMLPYAAPSHTADMAEQLGCPVQFSSGQSELQFDAAWLEHAPVQGNPATAMVAYETCERLLNEFQQARGITSRLIAELLRVPGRFPGIEAIAADWGMSSRTLRRKLADEGNAYQQVLDKVRCQLALDYLRDTRLNNDEIAAALGFTEAANFRQAFRRWTGMPPSRARTRRGSPAR